MLRKMFCVLLAVITFEAVSAVSKVDRQKLNVLYVGYRPDMPLPDFAILRVNAAMQSDYKNRMGAFKTLLEEYFSHVETVDVRDYREEMSRKFDVTVFDGLPKPVKATEMERDPIGYLSMKSQGIYLSEDFDSPALFVGYVADEMGHSLGLKLNWYCLCLFYHALNIRTEHPIFHRPFKVNITMEQRPTPEEFYHYSQDWGLPREIPMWRVERDSSRIGMVSGWYGLQEGDDAEFISGGRCAKAYENMAIGRHGNFFMWGFGAAPDRMTSEARTVFANAVSYISQFAGKKPVVRKYGYPLLRGKVEDFLNVVSPEGYQTYLKGVDTYNRWLAERQKGIRSKKEIFSAKERELLDEKPMEAWSRIEYVKKNSQFGLIYDYNMDVEAVHNYLVENMEYFYGGDDKGAELFIDEDVKSIGISNRDVRLLDTCISMLEEKREEEKALRILKRYTYQTYESAVEWRKWLEAYGDKLFFTEVGNYKYMGDGSVCIKPVKKEESGEKRQVEIYTELSGTGEEREVKIKFKIKEGYHIYASGGEDCPMQMTRIQIFLPVGVSKIGELLLPKAESFTKEVTVYKGEIEFVQKIKVAEKNVQGTTIVCFVEYQCCNAEICLNPQQELYQIPLVIK